MGKRLKRIARALLALTIVGALGYGGWLAWRSLGAGQRADRYAIRRVTAEVRAGAESATVRLTVQMTGPGLGRETRVPMLPPGVSLMEAKLDGEAAQMDLVDDRLAVIVRGSGERTAELLYALPLTKERRLSLALPKGISTSVEFALAEPGQAVKVPPPAVVQLQPAGKGTLARIITPPVDRLEISWYPKPTEVVTAARTAARTETLYTIQGDSLAARTVYSLRVDGRDVSQLVFKVAEGAVVDQTEAPWVKGWSVEKDRLLVQARGPLSGQNSLAVHHRRPLGAEEVDLAVPELVGAVRQWGYGAVATGGAVEIKTLSVERGSLIDPRGLPAALRSAGAAPLARAFRYDTVPSSQKLTLVRHRELETLEATCDALNALLAYTTDGRCMGKAVYTVRNARRQHLAVKLPEKAELWSAYVAGKPVRPAETEGGKLLVPLNCSAETASRGFAVELVYFAPGKVFGEKGKFAAALPQVDIPVMGVMLSVSMPEDIHLEDFGGGLRRVEAFAFALDPQDDKLVRDARTQNPADRAAQEVNKQLDWQIARGQRGQRRLRLDYEGLAFNGCFQKAMRPNDDNRNFLRQYYLENAKRPGAAAPGRGELNLTGFGQDELARITGLASLSITVPAGGQVYRFERQLLLGESAGVTADYWSALAAKPKADAEARLVSKVAALYDISPRGLRLAAFLDYRLDAGKVAALSYRLPANTRIISLRGANTADWSAENGKVEVKLVRPERTGGRLTLEALLPPLGKGEAELAAPSLAGARSEELVVAVGAPSDYELSFPEIEKLERLAPGALPGGLRNGQKHLNVFRLSAAAAGGVRAKAVRRSALGALQATCDSVNAISFFTEEGVGVTRAIFELRNTGQRHLEVKLPAGTRLWGAFVADRAVKPLAGEKGSVLLPLEPAEGSKVRSYPVEVVYIRPGKPFERRGSFAVALPEVNVPVMHAMYSLYMPQKLRLGRPAGTLKQVRSFSGPVAPPAPRGAGGASAEAAAKLEGRGRYYGRQMALEYNVSQREMDKAMGRALRKTGGKKPAPGEEPEPLAACGLKIYIPAVGRLLRFERHLVVDGKMNVSCAYRG